MAKTGTPHARRIIALLTRRERAAERAHAAAARTVTQEGLPRLMAAIGAYEMTHNMAELARRSFHDAAVPATGEELLALVAGRHADAHRQRERWEDTSIAERGRLNAAEMDAILAAVNAIPAR